MLISEIQWLWCVWLSTCCYDFQCSFRTITGPSTDGGNNVWDIGYDLQTQTLVIENPRVISFDFNMGKK